jgi:hypothetical protein
MQFVKTIIPYACNRINKLYKVIMNSLMKTSLTNSENDVLIDFSQERELAYWSAKLNATPERIKAAARACCSNAVGTLATYLNNYTRKSDLLSEPLNN